jgi:hypothetical protein
VDQYDGSWGGNLVIKSRPLADFTMQDAYLHIDSSGANIKKRPIRPWNSLLIRPNEMGTVDKNDAKSADSDTFRVWRAGDDIVVMRTDREGAGWAQNLKIYNIKWSGLPPSPLPLQVGSGNAGGKEVDVPTESLGLIVASGILKSAMPGAGDIYYVQKISNSRIKVFRIDEHNGRWGGNLVIRITPTTTYTLADAPFHIDSNGSNTKTRDILLCHDRFVQAGQTGYIARAEHKQDNDDEFQITRNGNVATIQRTDAGGGWSQNLKLFAINYTPPTNRPLHVGSGAAGGKEVDVPIQSRGLIGTGDGGGVLRNAMSGGDDTFYIRKMSETRIKVYRIDQHNGSWGGDLYIRTVPVSNWSLADTPFHIDSNGSNTKTRDILLCHDRFIQAGKSGYIGRAEHKQNNNDEFEITRTGNVATIRRTDAGGGWSQNLKLFAINYTAGTQPLHVGSGPAGGKEMDVPIQSRLLIGSGGLVKNAMPGAGDIYHIQKLSDSRIKVYRIDEHNGRWGGDLYIRTAPTTNYTLADAPFHIDSNGSNSKTREVLPCHDRFILPNRFGVIGKTQHRDGANDTFRILRAANTAIINRTDSTGGWSMNLKLYSINYGS